MSKAIQQSGGGLALEMKMQEALAGLQELATLSGWGSDTSTFQIIEILPPNQDNLAPEHISPAQKTITLIAARKRNAA